MSQLDDVLNNAAAWYPRMPPPRSFSRDGAKKYQKRIDSTAGTRDGRPIDKLAWAPDELRWYPHRMEADPVGYTMPLLVYGNDTEGNKVAPPRWLVLERHEPEQYASTWERGRYSRYDGSMWDWKGPCPPERYVELKVHCYHDGECCPCHGDECTCLNEWQSHCWGKYLDPNDRLLDWIHKTAWEARHDPDVDPTQDMQSFEAPQAQRDVVTREEKRIEKQETEITEFTKEMTDHWIKKPVSIVGLRRTESGLYLVE
jgi:hypothetical protein